MTVGDGVNRERGAHKKTDKEEIVADDRPPKPETIRPPLTWREAVFGRQTKPVWGHDV